MQASDLRRGDTFVEYDVETWASMTNSERKRARRVTVEQRLGACVAVDRTHIRTSAGDWCIPNEAPVTLVGHTAKVRAA
jgi:hypothetical protein